MADPMTAKFSLAALLKVKDAAAKVADTIHQMVLTVRVEEIPPFMYGAHQIFPFFLSDNSLGLSGCHFHCLHFLFLWSLSNSIIRYSTKALVWAACAIYFPRLTYSVLDSQPIKLSRKWSIALLASVIFDHLKWRAMPWNHRKMVRRSSNYSVKLPIW